MKLQMNKRVMTKAALLVALCGIAFLGACTEKKKKAPPPPPPPPPAPVVAPVISFDTLSQELKVDPRVQFAGDLSVNDEGFARASLKLVDAIVKGDTAALGKMTVLRVTEGISSLQSSQQWDESVKGLEAVRIIAAAPPPSNLSKEQAIPDPPANIKEAQDILDVWKRVYSKGMNADDAARLKSQIESQLKEISKVYKEQGRESELTTLGQYIVQLLSISETKLQNLFKPTSRMALLLAVQDAGGSYLVGWQAEQVGEQWMFDGAPTRPDTRVRASEWDGVGMNAFAIRAPDTAKPAEAAAAPAEKKGDEKPPAGKGPQKTGGG